MSHLLLYSIGPVQDFIATARRCQDLWFGSWLLSDLSATAARALATELGEAALIVPGHLTDGSAVANEIYAQLEDRESCQRGAALARAAIEARLQAHMDSFFDRVPVEGFHRSVAEAQVRDLIETNWVVVPVLDSYQTSRRRAKALLAQRKSTRAFAPVPWHGAPGSAAPKSSLDGTRESVLDEALYEDVRRGQRNPDWLMKHYRARPAERLSGVDLLKRLGQEVDAEGDVGSRPAFHSASHISAGPIRTRIARAGQRGVTALDAWFDLLRTLDVDVARFMVRSGTHSVCDVASAGGARALVPRVLPSGKGSGARGLDGYLLYEDRLVDVLEQSSPAVNEGRLSVARAGLQTLLNRIGWRRPVQPYYAFILADGDHMGKAIDSLTTVADHRRLSERLDAWAGTCRADIEGYLGTCIYAGGDDVLALVPLHTALECAAHLAESFHAMIENAAKELTPGGRPEQLPTLSVGMAIVHHMVPMKDALDLVRRAEKDAKVTRNALAIRVAKRSGGEIVARAAWDSPDGPLHLRIPEWCRVFSDEQLPDKAAFAMEEAVSLLIDDPTSREPHASSDVVEALARRALGRRRGGRGGDALGDELSKKLHLRFKKQADPGAAVRALSAELQIARLFLDAYDEAWGDLGPSASAVHAEEVR